MEIVSPENQFLLFFDEVRVPADALIGEDPEAGLPALFSGLNPERITVAAMACGTARYALERASTYTATRSVWGRPIGSHQGVAHPMAHAHIQVELARLMVAKAAALYDAGRDVEAGVNANMAKYASAEASAMAVDTAIQAHGGNGMTTEYGVATLLGATRAGRIAPVSREMILNFVAQHLMGQEKSY
jgi:alkylation response protein AidB-like acyl-CoA dehydrogenase